MSIQLPRGGARRTALRTALGLASPERAPLEGVPTPPSDSPPSACRAAADRLVGGATGFGPFRRSHISSTSTQPPWAALSATTPNFQKER